MTLETRCSDNDGSKRDIPSFIEARPPAIQNPFMRPRPQMRTNLMKMFEEDSEIEEPELVQVYLRMRPCDVPNNLYEVRNDKCLVTSLDTTTAGHGRRTQHNVSRMYTFSKIFGPRSTQKEVFEDVVKENLKKLPEGQSFTLLTYGASGSGKTYTLMGTVNAPGLVPRSLEYVFKLVEAAQHPVYKPSDSGADKLSLSQQEFELQWTKRLRHVGAPLRDKYRRMSARLNEDLTISNFDLSNRIKHYVWVSFVEIYNEAIYDLLAPPDKRTKLKIREDASGNVFVKDATQAFVRSGEEAYDVMAAGRENLVVAATGVHARSSRSHCIFTITMLTQIEGEVRSSCVRLCDLAGCERARATRNTGTRMLESRAINASLHVLERCLHVLRRKQRLRGDALVPYRESRLTRLLGGGLSGARGEAVAMVVALNPAPQYAHETRHVLALAAVAQDIQTNATLFASTLESSDVQDTSDSAEVMKLRADNELLHFELARADRRIRELEASMEEKQQETADTMKELVQEAKDMTKQYYESQLNAMRKQLEETIEEYESKLEELSVPQSIGTPNRLLQAKVSQLMTRVALLEDELSAKRLALARLEGETEYLRSCIDERDDQTYKKTTEEQNINSTEPDEIEVVTDSDDDSDPFNESLEPILKKDNNRTHLHENNKTKDINQTVDLIDPNNSTDTDINDEDTSIVSTCMAADDTDHLNHDSFDTVTNETTDLSITSSDKNKNESNDNDIVSIDIHQKNYKSIVNKSQDSSETIDERNFNEYMLNQTVDKNKDGDLINNSNKYHYESMDQSELCSDFSNENPTTSKNQVIEDDLISSLSESKSRIARGTYFVKDSGLFKSDEDTNTSKIIEDLDVSKQYDPTGLPEYIGLDEEKINSNSDKDKIKLNGNEDLRYPTKLSENMDLNDDKKDSNLERDEIKAKENADQKVSETLVNKIMNSLKSKPNNSDISLEQFEQLELATKDCYDGAEDRMSFGHIKAFKEKKTYFDDDSNKGTPKILQPVEEDSSDQLKVIETIETKTDNILKIDLKKDELLSSNPLTDKRSYFDNIDEPIAKHKTLNDIKIKALKNQERSPSIVKDVDEDYEPVTIKKLYPVATTKLPKKQDSIDLFESPKIDLRKNEDTSSKKHLEVSNVEVVRKSIEKLVLQQKTRNDKVESKSEIASTNTEKELKDLKSDPTKLVQPPKDLKEIPEFNITDEVKTDLATKEIEIPNITVQNQSFNETQNTTVEFEKIYKDISAVRATEFDLLITQDINMSQESTKQLETREKETSGAEEIKYNLRNKDKQDDRQKNKDDKKIKFDEILTENNDKTDKSRMTKRGLRLRRRKNDDDSDQDDKKSDKTKDKLKDLANLKQEFCDVTMGLPAVKREIKDISSPEKREGEEENLPPMMRIQSCPSKSVTRSRRKLFTPRAEPLEESLSQTGDSNERIHVPRPSYHRTRARRKL